MKTPLVQPRLARIRPAVVFSALALAFTACDESPSAAEPSLCAADEVLRLGVGESAIVPNDVPCTLRPQQGAQYALAWYDPQFLALAEKGPEPYYGADTRLNLTITEGDGSVQRNVAPSVEPLPAPPSDTRIAMTSGPSRALGVDGSNGPWKQGDDLRFAEPVCPAGCQGRVARVMDDWLVLVVEDASLGAETERTIALLDEVIPHFRQHALPMLRQAFTPELPVSGREAGQLVVLLRGDVTGWGGLAYGLTYADGSATHLLQVEMERNRDAGSLLEVLIHEVTHAFQLEFGVRSVPAAVSWDIPGTRWGTEGGATLMETEGLRRAAGRPYAGNADFLAAPRSSIDDAFLRQASLGNGNFISGYNPAASLLLDLVDRRVRAGDDLDTALREVARGAVEGWYGKTEQSPPRRGMTTRMQERIAGWRADEAILGWTLSAAADDVLAGGDLQNRTWLRVGEVPITSQLGWPPFREITGGSNRRELFSRPSGSSGWARLVDPGQGIVFRAASVPAVQWRLVRVK